MYSNKLICEILIYINENINNKIYIVDLEKIFFYNKYYIMKLFKKEIGMTIIEYINKIRIYNSIMNIKNSNDSLLTIALQNSFNSLEYFSEIVKQYTNYTPIQFKKYFHSKQISMNDYENITTIIINLYEVKNIKNKYLSNQKKETSPIKTLSIFK